MLKNEFVFVDVINSKLTDSKKCDIDRCRKTCEETQLLDLNDVITIHGFDELENEKIDVSCIYNYF